MESEVAHEEKKNDSRTPIVQIEFKDSQLSNTDLGKTISNSLERLNYMGAVTEFALNDPELNSEKTKRILKELNDHLKLLDQIYAPGQYTGVKLPLTDLLEAGETAMDSLKDPNIKRVSVPVDNEEEAHILLSKIGLVRHDISKVFSMINVIDHPKIFDRIVPDPKTLLVKLRDQLKLAPDFYTDLYDKEEISLSAIENSLKSSMEVLLRKTIRPADFHILTPVVEYTSNPDMRGMSVPFSLPWLDKIALNLAGNIGDLTHGDQSTRVKLETKISEEKDSVTLSVANTNTQVPQQIVENGFLEGVGENEGGEHIGMAKNALVLREHYDGNMSARNEVDEDGVSWAIIDITLPLNKRE